jgi:hypothetical protein
MAHPYKGAAHKNDPSWLGGVKKYVEADRGMGKDVVQKIVADNSATIRNYGGSKKPTAKAAYTISEEK